jgi:ribosomal protein S4
MRLFSKYKIYKKSNSVASKFPVRVLRFRRPKWKNIQKTLLFSQKTPPKFMNPFLIKTTFKIWEKLKTSYKSGLFVKNNIYKFLDSAVSKNTFKKQLFFYKKTNIRKIYLASIVLGLLRIDCLLQNLNFFLTSYQARQIINSRQILVNNKPVVGNYIVKKGDIISFSDAFSDPSLFTKNILKMYSINNHFFSFVEIDYYTKTIVILKDLTDLSEEDFYLFSYEHFDLKKFTDYL